MPATKPSLPAQLQRKRIYICVGAGGVGKTTLSAALALGLAARGQKVAVISIDPAKRLAGALGIEELDTTPRLIDPRLFRERGLDVRGQLWAMVLDSKRTFDQLIERLAPDERALQEILSNRIYREISHAVAGSQEFTAITKLYELDRHGEYDAIVLDTPPSRNALDFLEAPTRLTRFLEGRALAMFLTPGGITARLLSGTGALLFSAFARVSGVDLLADLSAFFRSLSGLIGGFSERSRGAQALLEDPASTFLLITTPEHDPAQEAVFLHGQLRARGMPFGGLVVNRVHTGGLAGHSPQELSLLLREPLGERLAARVAANLRDFDLLARRDAQNIERLRAELGEEDPLILPMLEGEIADIDGLIRVTRELFGERD
ncbi:MAG TPA: ArsA-related P-loop ATPase [Solirubrobacteraceae bacterium]